MAAWYRPDDKEFKFPMDDIALSVYHTRGLAKQQQAIRDAEEKRRQYYEQFAEYRNAHIEEIVAKAQKVDPAKVHKPLTKILQEKGIQVGVAVDFVGGSGKHAKWLFEQQGCNVIYSDVGKLTEKLPETFNDLEMTKNEDGSILLLKKDDPSRWVYGISALPNEIGKVGNVMKEMQRNGLISPDEPQLFLSNDTMPFFYEKRDLNDFAESVYDMMPPSSIADVSGRNRIKFGNPVANTEELIELFKKRGGKILYAQAEDSLSAKETAKETKHMRIIFQKPGIAA